MQQALFLERRKTFGHDEYVVCRNMHALGAGYSSPDTITGLLPSTPFDTIQNCRQQNWDVSKLESHVKYLTGTVIEVQHTLGVAIANKHRRQRDGKPASPSNEGVINRSLALLDQYDALIEKWIQILDWAKTALDSE